MDIKSHKLMDVPYEASPNRGKKMEPRFIVCHYTAGYSASSAINALTNKASKVSAHLVIGLDGTVTQLVPFDYVAWHAGPSRHMGYTGLNNCSIGIEIVNIGFLRRTASNAFQDAYGNVRHGQDFPLGMVEAPNPRVGSGTFYWPCYDARQIKAVDEIVAAITSKYDILDIVTHEEIDTRGWKTDPGPAFPMNLMKRHLQYDRNQDHEEFEITASLLNVRLGPGTEYGVERKLKQGAKVQIIERQTPWVRIDSDGWIHENFVRRV